MDNIGQRDDFYFQKEKRFQNSSKEIEIKKVSTWRKSRFIQIKITLNVMRNRCVSKVPALSI